MIIISTEIEETNHTHVKGIFEVFGNFTKGESVPLEIDGVKYMGIALEESMPHIWRIQGYQKIGDS